MKVIPDHTFESCPKLHILVVPGGGGTRKELKNPAMLNWLRIRASEVETLTSVCTGSMLLGLLVYSKGATQQLTGAHSIGCVSRSHQ